jgi:hypothetical protein
MQLHIIYFSNLLSNNYLMSWHVFESAFLSQALL